VKLMEPKAIEQNRYYQLGASKIIRCYVLMTLVDMYGDIPYTEALLGNENLTPKFDNGATVYRGVLQELDEAIAVINNPADEPGGDDYDDLYYDKSKEKWVTLAKTLKFKLLLSARLAGSDIGVPDVAGAISAILAEGDIIDTVAEDFQYRYGTSRFTPNTRHPLYNDQYEAGGGAYIANYYMWAMTSEKNFAPDFSSALNDPRLPFYFYKQDANPAGEDTFVLPGRTRPPHFNSPEYASEYFPTVFSPYVVSNWTNSVTTAPPANGLWGRDHGDNSGIPQDATKRTVAGIYPIGGAGFSPSTGSVQTGGNKGLLGAGIMPMLLSSWVNFMKAEAILELGIPGDAKAEFLAGINASISKVTEFGKDQEAYPTVTANQTNAINNNKAAYPTFMATKYDESANKLEIVIKEYYLAAWGNGIETYNNYRRTGYPSNFQPTVQPVSGAYYYRALYAASTVNNNPNTPANDRTRRVFWDKANITLH
jgi:SusD/RagB-like outer membrane lipoprotein